MATRSCDWTVGSGREKKQQRGRNVSVASEVQLEVLSGVFRQKRTFNENVRCCIVLKATDSTSFPIRSLRFGYVIIDSPK